MENQTAITCSIENNNIYKIEYGNKTCIGVTADAYTQLKESAEKALIRNDELAKEKDKYYQMLIEHGIITKPKTTEELLKETQDQQANIMKTLNSLTSVLEKLNSRMEVVENEVTRPNDTGTENGNRTGQDTTSLVNV